MNQERLMKVLLAPHVSEKSTTIADVNNQVAFKVARDATKPEIKSAVELMFNVKVRNVTVVSMKGKRKRFGLKHGRRSNWKKAYVALEAGHTIELVGAE
jgi:large subunit ribosomal protein L23